MITYKVYINGVLLRDVPEGINSYEQSFVRDTQIFGIYTINVLNLVFVGDGYCALEKLYREFAECEVDFEIKESCNGSLYTSTFLGSIPIAKIAIDYTNKRAEAEIEDRSPLSLISQFAESSFDFESTEDVFGNTLQTPAVIDTTLDFFDELTNFTPYPNRPNISTSSVISSLVSFMTGYPVTFQSDFFSETTLPNTNEWAVTWTSPPSAANTTVITYKNFAGQIRTKSITSGSGSHIQDVANAFLTGDGQFTPVTPTTAPDIRTFFTQWAHSDFEAVDNLNVFTGFDLFSTHPIEIISIEVTVGTGVVTFSQTTPYVDGARLLRFLNYRMLRAEDAPYQFQLTFKELMTDLNKQFNCYFLASYVAGSIHIRLEDSPYFEQFTQTLTLDNVQELKSSLEDESIFDSADFSDASGVATIENDRRTYTSRLCGISNKFDGQNGFIYDPVQIWLDLAETFDEKKNDVYMVQQQEGSDNTLAARLDLPSTILNYYNPYLSNQNALYRHFNKFKGDLTASPDMVFTNTSIIKRFKKYEFVDYLTQAQYNTFIDTFVDNIKFKRKEDTDYYTGIIMEAKYTKSDGRTEFTVLGQ